MENFDEIYKTVQSYEAKIQAAKGEAAALKWQLEKEQASMKELEESCQSKFQCSLEDLELMEQTIAENINKMFEELSEKVKSLD